MADLQSSLTLAPSAALSCTQFMNMPSPLLAGDSGISSTTDTVYGWPVISTGRLADFLDGEEEDRATVPLRKPQRPEEDNNCAMYVDIHTYSSG